jgi:hypothetical protein
MKHRWLLVLASIGIGLPGSALIDSSTSTVHVHPHTAYCRGGRYFMARAEDADGQKDPNVVFLTHSAAYGTPGLGEGLLLNLFRLIGRGIRALLRYARR